MNSPTPVVVANLKANKTWSDIEVWLDTVAPASQSFQGTVIFCPSFPFLPYAYEKIKKQSMNIKLGSQDISRFEQGAFTGEVAASQIANFIEFSIIGHSERREKLIEDDKTLNEKVENALKSKIEPIFCVQNEKTPLPDNLSIIAYEPPSSIGSGEPDTPENVRKITSTINKEGKYTLLYGGSVSAQNVNSYVELQSVHGVLIGATNSLDPKKFIAILEALR